MRLKTQINISFAPLFAAVVIVFGLVVFAVAHTAIHNDVNARLIAFANLQTLRLENQLRHQAQLLAMVASRTQLRIQLRTFAEDGDTARLERIERILRDAQQPAEEIISLKVANLDGLYIVSTNDKRRGGSLQHEQFIGHPPPDNLQEWVGDGRSGLLQRELDGQLHSFLIGPLRLEGALLGYLVMESRPDFINAIAYEYTGMGKTGETVIGILSLDGGLEFLSKNRFPEQADSNVPNRLLPLYQAASGTEVLLRSATDYRRAPVVAITRYLEDSRLGIVVKMDRDEAYAPLQPILMVIVALATGSWILVYLISIFLARSLSQPLEILSRKAARLMQERGHDPDTRTPYVNDEINTIAQSIDLLLDESLRSQHDLVHERITRRGISSLRERGTTDHGGTGAKPDQQAERS